ncbi:MAG: zinc ribbon domain-containing protein, partial [Phycisphaerae bacterium]
GELDHKAVEELDVLQEELSKWEKNATPEQSEKIEKTVSEAYELLEDRKIEDAIKLGKKVLEDLKQGSGGDQTFWLTFAEFILHEYNWALNPQQAYNLSKLIEDAKKALSEGSSNSEQKLDQLRDSINKLPDVIHALLWLKGEIARLQIENPVLAKELMNEVQEVEEMLKRMDPQSASKLLRLCEKVRGVTDGLGKIKCPSCGKEYESNRKKCPSCGDDRELLERFRGGLGGSSGSFDTRSVV